MSVDEVDVVSGVDVMTSDDPAGRYARRLLEALPTSGIGSVAGDALEVAAAPDSGVVTDWALSGAMMLTGAWRAPPLSAPTTAATAMRGALLGFDALVPQPPAISGHELLGERAALAGYRRNAPWSPGGHCRAVATSDGWVAVSLLRPDDVAAVPAITQGGHDESPWRALDRWAMRHSAEEVATRIQLLGVAAGVVPAQPQSHWPPWRITSSGQQGHSNRSWPPLVVDMSALWAGPLCGHLLGQAGAQVVRVESVHRPDGGRAGLPAFDDLLHAGQLSVAVDFASSDGRARLRDLVGRADIVITSARPRALHALGIVPTDVLADRADAVWVDITAYPPGPLGETGVGFGDDVAMAAGLVRWLDGVPVPCGDAIADPLTGVHAALAAVASYQAGGRHHIALSLLEVAASTAASLPAATVERVGRRWVVSGEHGTSDVRRPRARLPRGTARPLGIDTDRVFHQ